MSFRWLVSLLVAVVVWVRAPSSGAQTWQVDCAGLPAPTPAGATATAARFTVHADGSIAFDASALRNTVRLNVPTVPLPGCEDAKGATVPCLDGVARFEHLRAGKREALACGAVRVGVIYLLPVDVDEWSLFTVEFFGAGKAQTGALVARQQEIVAREKKRLADAMVGWWKGQLHAKVPAVGGTVDQVLEHAADTAKALKAFREKELPVDAPLLRELATAIEALEKELAKGKSISEAEVERLLSKLKLPAKRTSKDDYCRAEVSLATLSHASPFLRLVRAELPATSTVEVIPYSGGLSEAQYAHEKAPLGVLVQGVPAGRAISTETTVQQVKQGSPGEVVASFLPVLLKAFAAVGPKMAVAAKSVCGEGPYALDVGGDAVAPLEARGFVLAPSGHNATQLRVCEGEKCTTDGATPSVRNTVVVAPAEHARLALLVDFGGNYGRAILTRAGERPDGFSEPGYSALNGNDSLTQAFALRYQDDVRRNIVLSLLFGVRGDRWALAFGPGLVDASGEDALRQWNVRFGWKLAKDFFLTGGGGFRFIDRPVPGSAPTLVVSRTPEAPATPPALQTETGTAWTVGLGVALDLAFLPDVGKDLLKNVGGAR